MKMTADQFLKIAGIAPTTTLRARLNESSDSEYDAESADSAEFKLFGKHEKRMHESAATKHTKASMNLNVSGFVPPIYKSGKTDGVVTVSHKKRDYTFTGKAGKDTKSGEDSYEYSHRDKGTEHRIWVTKSGKVVEESARLNESVGTARRRPRLSEAAGGEVCFVFNQKTARVRKINKAEAEKLGKKYGNKSTGGGATVWSRRAPGTSESEDHLKEFVVCAPVKAGILVIDHDGEPFFMSLKDAKRTNVDANEDDFDKAYVGSDDEAQYFNTTAMSGGSVKESTAMDDMDDLAAAEWIASIANPSVDQQMAAVKIDPDAIEYIDEPAIEVQEYVVRRRPDLIVHIYNPSEEIQMLAVENGEDALENIKKPTRAVRKLHAEIWG